MGSILTSIKKLLGIPEEQENFDKDLITYINTVFSVINQLGVGPAEGFKITGSSELWNDFLHDDNQLELVKTYVYMRVKLMFDPPNVSYVLEAQKNIISEMEFRMMAVMGERR